MIRRNGKPAKQIPAIEDRRLGQLLTGVSVKNIPALTLNDRNFTGTRSTFA
jgi:hypothetical protein